MEKWGAGVRRADCPVIASAESSNGMFWRRQALEARSVKHIRHSGSGSFMRRPRPCGAIRYRREKALSLRCDSVCTIYTDAPGTEGRGATLGERLMQGH